MTGEDLLKISIGVVAVMALFAFAEFAPVAAHDADRPDLDNWFMGLMSKGKSPCCDGSEAMRLDDVDWESKGGNYRVRLDGEWVVVPDGALVEGPNKDGRAMVWPYFRDGKLIGVRCFIPGAAG
jgi:hypothetical protein